MIKTNKGNEYLVDQELMPVLGSYKWREDKKGYALTYINCRCSNCQGKKQTTCRLHKLVYLYHYNTGCLNYSWYKQGLEIDHRNNDKRDNRVENLQFLTKAMNTSKQGNRTKCSSQYNGVSWHKQNKKWLAQYQLNGKLKYIGYFTNEIEAAKAFDAKCREAGLDRLLNFS